MMLRMSLLGLLLLSALWVRAQGVPAGAVEVEGGCPAGTTEVAACIDSPYRQPGAPVGATCAVGDIYYGCGAPTGPETCEPGVLGQPVAATCEIGDPFYGCGAPAEIAGCVAGPYCTACTVGDPFYGCADPLAGCPAGEPTG